jgi:DNA mismatch repair protein MutS
MSKANTNSKTATQQLTPAMRQYHEQKAAVPDALLLFRMGDFYELFYEDAEIASRILGIALTSRSKEPYIPLAGIPYHALESYLPKLVQAGHKVAVSEQTEDPKQAKGVVKREIVRIITAGTLTDDNLLDQSADNYLACVCFREKEVGLAFVELSTGAFQVQQVTPDEIADELVRLQPAELLLADSGIDKQHPLQKILAGESDGGQLLPETTITKRSDYLFDSYQAEQTLCKHFGVSTLEGFGFDHIDAALSAAGAIIEYLGETQKTSLKHIIKLTRRFPRDYVWIDQSTWRSLEVERTLRSGSTAGSLLKAVDRTASAMGSRCLRRWLIAPLRDPEAISRRQQAIADLLADPHQLQNIREHLDQLADIERITARLGVGRATPRDLVALGRTVQTVDNLAGQLDDFEQQEQMKTRALCPFLQERREAIKGQRELGDYLTNALSDNPPLTMNEGGIIASGFDEELDRLRCVGTDGQQWLAEFQAREIKRTGIPSLKVGFNQVFGYYIEITNTHRDRAPAEYVRKQTLKNAERYITEELKNYETEVLTARDKANTREAELFEQIRQYAVEQIARLQTLALAVAEIDAIAGLACLADRQRYVRPEITDQRVLEISEGRHPVLEQTLAEKFVPNDTTLGRNKDALNSLMIITGPNMAGKSTYIRQIALLTLLAQTGSFVPAAAMRFKPVDRIFARVGASDEITRGQSTFMVEMTEAANILNNAGPDSLVIIDELGRGTSTFDGLALAWALAEHLANRIGCLAFFATHYHELTQLEQYLKGVVNYNVAVREWAEEVIFLHRIVPGSADRSYGVHVAKLAGVNSEVIYRSREILAELESNFSSTSRAPKRAAKRTRPDDQMMLFSDPQEEVLKEIRQTDPDNLTPLQALETINRWRNKLNS